jgi:acetoin utilization protein AcuB
MFVRDWMVTPGPTLPDETPLSDALRFMEQRDARAVAVLGPGRVDGPVFLSDLYKALASEEIWPCQLKRFLRDLVEPPLLAVAPDVPLEDAAHLMAQQRVAALAVIRRDQVTGIVSESDVTRAFALLMGAGGRGGRSTLRGGSASELLEEVRATIRRRALRSIALYPSAGGGWEAVLRTRRRSCGPTSTRRP